MRENIKVLRHFLAMCEGQILYDEIQREIDHKVVKRKPKDTSNAIPIQIKRKKEDYGFWIIGTTKKVPQILILIEFCNKDI